MKLKCGPKGLKFSGLEMEIKTPRIFIAKLLNVSPETILKEYIIMRADGELIRELWWTQWCYQGQFTSSNLTSFNDILEQILHLVTEETNSDLMGDFTAHEAEVALKQMAPLKSPEPDSMPPTFYQNYWSLVGSDVTNAILMYLNTGTFPSSLDHSFITLIPKVKNLENISQYRPISLSDVLYRVYS